MNGKMIEQKIETGYKLLEECRFDDSYQQFVTLRHTNHHEVFYGMATALFRKIVKSNSGNLEIVALQISIAFFFSN